MTTEKLKIGNDIEERIGKLYTEKKQWERAVKIYGANLGSNESSAYYIGTYELTDDEFRMVKYMRLQRLEEELRKLNTEFEIL